MSDSEIPRSEKLREATTSLIRKKMSNIYEDEPGYNQELKEITHNHKNLSKHQLFIQELHQSGKPSHEIQLEWHKYYEGLPDDEKQQVWDEFYKANGQSQDFFDKVSKRVSEARSQDNPDNVSSKVVVVEHVLSPKESNETQNRQSPKRKLSDSVKHNATKLGKSQQLKSLGFGLIAGTIAILIFLFSFFNQVIITPFIQPSRNAVSTPIILDTSGLSNITTPEIIIPKLNLEIPVDYTETSTNEANIENDLNGGIVHYPSTVLPGQNGNTAFFGHSSNNIFNPGQYKFAFVLLHTLVKGDTFYLVYNSKVYVYQVFNKVIVPPSDVSVLNPVSGHQATAALITCDPPGTSINRLVVYGDQISPAVNTNSTPSSTTNYNVPKSLPGNGQSLWSRFIHWL